MNSPTSSTGPQSNNCFGYCAPPVDRSYTRFSRSVSNPDVKPIPVPAAQRQEGSPAKKTKKRKFPEKLYDMLQYAAKSEWNVAVSWSDDGRSFSINNRDKLIELLPHFFQQTKFRSFTRQLNLWGFSRVTPEAWGHPNFLRGNAEGLELIAYVKVKGGTKGDGPKKSKRLRLAHKQRQTKAKKSCKGGSSIGNASENDDRSLSSGNNRSVEDEEHRDAPEEAISTSGSSTTLQNAKASELVSPFNLQVDTVAYEPVALGRLISDGSNVLEKTRDNTGDPASSSNFQGPPCAQDMFVSPPSNHYGNPYTQAPPTYIQSIDHNFPSFDGHCNHTASFSNNENHNDSAAETLNFMQGFFGPELEDENIMQDDEEDLSSILSWNDLCIISDTEWDPS